MKRMDLGDVTMPRGVILYLVLEDVLAAIQKFANYDWGDSDPESKKINDEVKYRPSNMRAVYHDSNGTEFWIDMDSGKGKTTICWPRNQRPSIETLRTLWDKIYVKSK